MRKRFSNARGITGLHANADPLPKKFSSALVAIRSTNAIAEVGEESEGRRAKTSQRLHGHGLDYKVTRKVFVFRGLFLFCTGGDDGTRSGCTAAVARGETVDACKIPS